MAGRRSRRSVHLAIVDCLDVLRYMRDRWKLDGNGHFPDNHPALHAHEWRALADDADTVIGWLTSLRDTAREEEQRLGTLNGD